MARKLIHTRTVVVRAYDEGDGSLTFEGTLQDVQPLDAPQFQRRRKPGENRPPGVVHGMEARFRIDRATGEIKDVDGVLPYGPYRACGGVVPRLGRLTGLPIAPGFIKSFREVLGGPQGCVHMNALIQLMAHTQGAASSYYNTVFPWERGQQTSLSKGMCHVWAADGPIVTALAQGRNLWVEAI